MVRFLLQQCQEARRMHKRFVDLLVIALNGHSEPMDVSTKLQSPKRERATAQRLRSVRTSRAQSPLLSN
jgi:hypothetical protein